MTLKIQIVRDGEVIADFPLERDVWAKETLETELSEVESTIDPVSEMHDLFSNNVRTRMLSEMIRSSDRRFGELMDIVDANQKIVSEHLRRMIEKGLATRVETNPSEVHYVPTEKGFASMLTCMVTRRILDELDAMEVK
ncbi:MAG: winged helix-turn-helix transcriptional regulator [Nitrososphaerales archaeon]